MSLDTSYFDDAADSNLEEEKEEVRETNVYDIMIGIFYNASEQGLMGNEGFRLGQNDFFAAYGYLQSRMELLWYYIRRNETQDSLEDIEIQAVQLCAAAFRVLTLSIESRGTHIEYPWDSESDPMMQLIREMDNK